MRGVGLSVLGLVVLGCSEELRPPPPNIIPSPAPQISLKNLEGQEVSSREWAGRWVILNFFARWSPGSVKEIPDLLLLQNEFGSEGVQVVGVSVDEAPTGVIREFLEKMNVTYPVLLGNIEAGNDFGGLDRVPTTFLIDRNWNVVNRFTGQVAYDEVRLELRAHLQEEERRRKQQEARQTARSGN